ncbi:Cytoplasmic trehalase [Sphingomonas sp. EC-HK361]|uniref:alpha,alpha-trehalase TreF n=1 Tax=Sphingomonas sp. EC-HK361 TaxID=2038397 RepID=UPI001253F06C|nr:alpha,alpha-trehalase TreF [Sphingomonas sp. EC-HK361]VVS98746.1 Cytoplasmic trehalase [Sphingomonas sp. EC-HK361]
MRRIGVRWIAVALAAAPLATPVGARDTAPAVATPADLYGPLFEAVQMRRIFPDGKTFVDAVAKRPAQAIVADYRKHAPMDDAALKAFVLANFAVPGILTAPQPSAARPPIADHIRALWPVLTRAAIRAEPGSSALALPRPFVVPGGRFREIYYWDSYFTMLGLQADGRQDLIEGMIDDFVSLVERYGHVPNGARTYYVSRSQPPFLYLMMGLSRTNDPAVKARRLAALKREHEFWTSAARTTRLPDGSALAHYGDARSTPRDESWREDVETARGSSRPVAEVQNALRAGAESGWDFSSRWFADGRRLATIDTPHIVPADLNALLYGQERAIATMSRKAGDTSTAARFDTLAVTRAKAVERWLWDAKGARYGDFDTKRRTLRPGLTAASAYPLFTGLASTAHAKAAAETIGRRLIAPGGVRTSLVVTGQQWDRPNGWAPLQWVTIAGLRRAGRDDLARRAATRFLATVEREYQASGKLLEKYDVEESRPGGGGEYPTQDGFGWTNGVVRAIQLYLGESPARH